MDKKTAITKTNKLGALLVFPIKNSPEPDSLWAQFFPRKKMKWEWSDESDNRVADLWHLMKRLSDCRHVVYSKWYQGRATFFSIKLFTAMLALMNSKVTRTLSPVAKTILDTLEMDSPLSTRDVKAHTDLQGKFNEPAYNKAMKELFARLLVVAYGEVDDGAFPSLAVGATRLIYEEIWNGSQRMNLEEARQIIDKYMPAGSKFRTFFDKILIS